MGWLLPSSTATPNVVKSSMLRTFVVYICCWYYIGSGNSDSIKTAVGVMHEAF
jgi:hypothetical protein